MSDEQNQVVHSVDGIEEYDNRLPRWWLATLYAAVVFAIGYWFSFHVFKAGELPREAWRAEVMEAAQKEGAVVTLSSGDLADLAKDPAIVAEGRALFTSTCVACHGPTGGGTIGPNLTDAYWLHGGEATAIYATVKDGVTAKGMPAWGPQLGGAKVQAAVAYVLTLRDTNVAGGKLPQGTLIGEGTK